jgi:hypothetical protein
MGCDIHFYIEKRYFYPITTLKAMCIRKVKRMSKNPNFKKQLKLRLPEELRNAVATFQEHKWKFIHEEEYYKEKKNGEDRFNWTSFDSRHYLLFGILADVRGMVKHCIASRRGLPKDTTRPIRQEYKRLVFSLANVS